MEDFLDYAVKTEESFKELKKLELKFAKTIGNFTSLKAYFKETIRLCESVSKVPWQIQSDLYIENTEIEAYHKSSQEIVCSLIKLSSC